LRSSRTRRDSSDRGASEIRDGAQSPTAGLQVAAPSGTFTTEYCASSDSNSTYAELR